jgi:hypothetical protein
VRSRMRSPWIRTTSRQRICGSALEKTVNRRPRAVQLHPLRRRVRAHRFPSPLVHPPPDECRRLHGRRSRDAFADAGPCGRLRKHRRPSAAAILKGRKRRSLNSIPSHPAIPDARQSPPLSSRRLCSRPAGQHRRHLRRYAHPLPHRGQRPHRRAQRPPLRRGPVLPRDLVHQCTWPPPRRGPQDRLHQRRRLHPRPLRTSRLRICRSMSHRG